MATDKWSDMLDDLVQENRALDTEFAPEEKKRQELLVARIYKLSHLLSSEELPGELEAQLKVILEDLLAELDMINQQCERRNYIKRHFH